MMRPLRLRLAFVLLVVSAFCAAAAAGDVNDAPHDAPVSPRAPLHLPRHLHGLGAEAHVKRSADDAHERSGKAVMVKGEWLVMVGKSHRDDFAAVLDDMGHHLSASFGMSEWFDVDAIRASKRAHHERQLRRRTAGEEDEEEEKPWTVQAEANGHMALEFDQRMLVKLAVPSSLHHRQYDIVESLRNKEWTQFIEPNLVVRTTATQTQILDDSEAVYPWGIDRIDQRNLPLDQSYTYANATSNVRIYVVDTGIRTSHQEFEGRASWGTNILGDGVNYDCDGHGTHVAGTAIGSYVGVAKDVRAVAVKVLDCDGSGTVGGVIQGINWAVNNCPSGIKCIISLSLGGEDISLSLDDMIESAHDRGVVVVVAAGNDNVDACGSSPARSPYGITVGASTRSDRKASFSNYGPCVNVWAPGVDIPSSYSTADNEYYIVSGTSQATPHVSGALALYLGAIKSVTPSEAAGALYASATKNKLGGSLGIGAVNRLLYSQINRGAVLQTAALACNGTLICQTINGSLTSGSTAYSSQMTVGSGEYRNRYLQGWLEATADFDLKLQYYSGATWSTVATSSGGTGSEWMQFATSATGPGRYRFAIVAAASADGSYEFSYEGNPAQPPSSASAVTRPFWLPLLRAFFHQSN